MLPTSFLSTLLTLLTTTASAKKPKAMTITIDPRPCLSPNTTFASPCISLYDTPQYPTAPADSCPAAHLLGSFQPYSTEYCIPIRTPYTALALRGTSTSAVECRVFADDRCRDTRAWTRPVRGLESTCLTWSLKRLPDGARSLKCFDMRANQHGEGHAGKGHNMMNPFVKTSVGYGDGSDEVEKSWADGQEG